MNRSAGSKAAFVPLVLFACALSAGTLHAQQLQGRVTDRLSGAGLDGVSIQLVDGEGALLRIVVSDREGRFQFRSVEPGRYGLFARRMGYHPEAYGPFSLAGTDSLNVDLTLEPDPFLLDSLRVEVERRGLEEGRSGFARRCAEADGYCFSPDSIWRMRPRFVSDIIRLGVPEMIVSYPGGLVPTFRPVNHWPCMTIFVDHHVEPTANLDSLGVGVISGVEVHLSFSKTPVELRTGLRGKWTWPSEGLDTSWGPQEVAYPCGVIQVWTRAGW